MKPSMVYPSAFGGPSLSTDRRIFNVVPVTVGTICDNRICATHWHDFLQIWYTVSGSYSHTVNGIPTRQEAGSATLVFPYTSHYIDSTDSNLSETLVVQISIKKDTLENLGIPFFAQACNAGCFDTFSLPSHIHLHGSQKRRADRICTELLFEYHKKLDMNSYKMLMLTADFLTLCIDESAQKQSARTLQANRERNACIDEAMLFLKDNYKQDITLDDICNAAMMSRRSFTNGFRAVTGKCCSDYLRNLRMRSAIELLRKTKKSIGEIAEETGFYDSSHFYKICMDLYGVPPLTLRRDLSQWTREYGDALYQRSKRSSGWALVFDEASLERHRCAMSFY